MNIHFPFGRSMIAVEQDLRSSWTAGQGKNYKESMY